MPKQAVSRTSPLLSEEQLAALRDLIPEAFTEGKVDFEKLRTSLGDLADERPERYSFSWAGKRDAIRLLGTPSRATLILAKDESLEFDTTQNLFIEGDNLEVLKLLYKPYFGRVKMIYIDPPYNTGNDFVYPDNYTDPLDTYLQMTGQKDSDGNLLTSNPETGGRYHSAWLSMMYPRLFLARQLLRDNGVIFVSIDDHEVHDLRLLMNEIYGEENFIAQLVWEKGRKNDAKLFSVGHEYVVIFAKSSATLRNLGVVWREPKPGAQEIWEKYQVLRQQIGGDDEKIEKAIQDWYKSLPETHPSKKLSRYRHIDNWGPWRDRDISWPGGGGPSYDVIHPTTKKPCKVPESGWRFATPEEMQRQIRLGLVVFRQDHTQPPFRKAHLRPLPDELMDDEGAAFDDENGFDEAAEVGMQVMPSYLYKQSQVAVKYLRKLMGAKVFDNPKDHEILARLIRYVVSDDDNAMILDFFAGSGSTAEAVLQLNRQYKSSLKYILVQLPEPTPPKSNARKAGYVTISELAMERIRRVVARMKKEREGQMALDTPEDLGFKVFKLAESNFKAWAGAEMEAEAYVRQAELFADPLVTGWKPENLLYEVAIKEGYGLNVQVEKTAVKSIQRVTDPDMGQSFYLCLAGKVALKDLRPLNLQADDLFICRDSALDDEATANLALQCRLKTI